MKSSVMRLITASTPPAKYPASVPRMTPIRSAIIVAMNAIASET